MLRQTNHLWAVIQTFLSIGLCVPLYANDPDVVVLPDNQTSFDAPQDKRTDWKRAPAALIQCIDKVSALCTTLKVPNGQTVQIGRLVITLHQCFVRQRDPLETAALLEIWQQPLDNSDQPKRLYYHWIFSSSKGIHTFEHAQYHVTIRQL